MSNPNPDRDERDERVRGRALNKIQKTLATMRRMEHDDVHAHAYVRDVTKLLSLLDSQAAGGVDLMARFQEVFREGEAAANDADACTCDDLTEVQRAQGDHYDDCPRTTKGDR